MIDSGFAPADHDTWRRLVDRVLDRSGELDAAELEQRFRRTLVTETIDGLRIEPLYTADDAGPDPGWPGQVPFTRGTRALGHRSTGWGVRQPVPVTDDAARVRELVLDELERGTTQVLLEWPAGADTGSRDGLVDHLDRCLDGVYLDLAKIAVDAAGREPEVAAALVELAGRRGVDAAALPLVVGFDPVGRWLRSAGTDHLDDGIDAALGLVQSVHDLPGVVPLAVDAALIHEAGGGDVEELGTALAIGVHLLRAMVDAGVDVDVAARALEFRYAATPDQFTTIAKLRAARRTWQRVAEIAGASTAAQRQRQHATSSRATATRYDPWVNLLRSTVAAFAAGVGGADSVTVRPHDELVTEVSAVGRRMARNAQLILIEESNLARVVDMAGGSWYVESLTDQLARAGWAWFQTIERAGGIVAAATSGLVQDRVDELSAQRDRAVATRRAPLTGLSEFPAIDEEPPPPLPDPDVPTGPIRPLVPRRHGWIVERVRQRADRIARDTGRRPEVFLANLGTPATHTARATFAKNFFEVGGVRAITSPGFHDADAAAAAFAESGAEFACICASDPVHQELAVATAAALAARGPRRLFLAGRPAGLDDELRRAGVDEHVVAGGDVVATLSGALDLIGGAA